MRRLRNRAALLLVPSVVPLVSAVAVLVLATGCRGGPPDAGAAAPEPAEVLAEAVAATRTADTGRVRLDVELRVDVPPVPRAFRAGLDATFDRTRPALAAALDMSEALADLPELVAAYPAAAEVDGVELRVLGEDAWVRYSDEAGWRRRDVTIADLADLGGLMSADALLDLVGEALGSGAEVIVDADGVHTGHVGVDAVLAARPDHAAPGLAGAADALPPALAERAFRFDVRLDEGTVRELTLELDVEGLADELGEPVPHEVVIRWTAAWSDLGRAVEIRVPE